MARKDYTKPANTALKLITKNGGDAILKHNTATPNPATPWIAPTPIWSPYDTQAVLLPIGKDDVAYLPDTLAIESMSKILMEAVEMVQIPKNADKVEYKGETWIIKSIKPLKPADVNVMWTLFVGK